MRDKIETDLLMGELIYKQLRGEISRDEQELLNSWVNNQENEEFFVSLKTTDRLYQQMMYQQDIDIEAHFRKLQRKMKKRRLHRIWRWSGVAALLIIGAGTSWMWRYNMLETQQKQVFVMMRPALSVDKTVLLTAQGEQLYFADTVKKVIASGKQVTENAVISGLPVPQRYNLLATSLRSTVEMQLPDSSRVWLNAGSELRYPEAFEKDKRVVWLKGEAYFEVTKDSRCPFIVEAGEAKIEVLGTQFNVNATELQPCVTTLVTGCVKVYNRNNESLIILPGQQVEARPDGKMWMRPVDIRYYVAWRKNQFAFHEETLLNILNVLSEWYDFTFDITDIRLVNQLYTAIIPRSSQVDDVLNILALTGDFEYVWSEKCQLMIKKIDKESREL